MPVQSCEVFWKGWSVSPSGCLSAGCGPKHTPLHLPEESHRRHTQSCTCPVSSSPLSKDTLESLGVHRAPPQADSSGSREPRHQRERPTLEERRACVARRNRWTQTCTSSNAPIFIQVPFQCIEFKRQGKRLNPQTVVFPGACRGQGHHADGCSARRVHCDSRWSPSSSMLGFFSVFSTSQIRSQNASWTD